MKLAGRLVSGILPLLQCDNAVLNATRRLFDMLEGLKVTLYALL